MKKIFLALALLAVVLSACGPSAPVPTSTETLPPAPTETPTQTASPTETPTVTSTPVPLYPPEGYGPADFPTDVDPLTGLKVSNPSILDRRPMLIKVQNLPRYSRPQWGLSLADIVFEYYTEEGTTRFAAIFYSQDAEEVGPIRSGRFIDSYLVRGYKAVFAFGYAYVAEMDRFLSSGFNNRLVIEVPGSPMKRFDPNGYNYLVVNTADLSAYATQKNMENVRQDLNGMFFQLDAPAGGQPAASFFTHYSGSIYNRWDYYAASGKYLRWSDTVDAFVAGEGEKYAQLTDRLNDQPIGADNVVIVKVNHQLYSPGIYDIQFSGSGDGWAFRDGQMYPITWHRDTNDIVSLTNPDGSVFAMKPGNTWFEVMGMYSTAEQTDLGWRFTHFMP